MHGQKNNFRPGAPEAKICSKNDQKCSGPKFGNLCILKVVGNCILSGKYIKTMFESLTVQKLRPIKRLNDLTKILSKAEIQPRFLIGRNF